MQNNYGNINRLYQDYLKLIIIIIIITLKLF